MENNEHETTTVLKNLVGYSLVIIGVVTILWVVVNVVSMFEDPEKLTPFQRLVSSKLESSISFENERVLLLIPPEFLAYFIPISLLSIAVAAAKIVVTGGIKLLGADLGKTITEKVNSVKDTFDQKLGDLKEILGKGTKS
jgi:hypothetical protein